MGGITGAVTGGGGAFSGALRGAMTGVLSGVALGGVSGALIERKPKKALPCDWELLCRVVPIVLVCAVALAAVVGVLWLVGGLAHGGEPRTMDWESPV